MRIARNEGCKHNKCNRRSYDKALPVLKKKPKTSGLHRLPCPLVLDGRNSSVRATTSRNFPDIVDIAAREI